MTTNPIADRSDLVFSNAFLNALAEAMTDACGAPWRITVAPDEDAAVDEAELVRIMLTLDGSLCGECLLELSRSEASMLVSKQLRQPVKEFGEEQIADLCELVETASRAFGQAVEQEYGVFKIMISSTPAPQFDRTNMVRVAVTNDDGDHLSVVMCLDSALKEGLSIHSQGESEADGATAEKNVVEPVNLDLVMNVELNVTLRFGQRHLTLREVLDLTSGSVVELDRQVDEPVELLLNGEVIAKGEAVVIDGNYGLRVSEVLKPVSSMVLD
jgi:flagellar motor switch protein FliN/FliY